MTDKEAVIDALATLPENALLEEIIEKLLMMAAVRRGRAAIAAGGTRNHEEVRHLVESWANS